MTERDFFGEITVNLKTNETVLFTEFCTLQLVLIQNQYVHKGMKVIEF